MNKKALTRVLPVGFALAPIGFLFGFLAAQANWSVLDVFLLSTLGFSGSGQFAFLGFFQSGINTVGVSTIFIIILSMNLRYIPMSLSASQPAKLNYFYKSLYAHILADESFAVENNTDSLKDKITIRLVVFLFWILSTTTGCLLAAFVPESISKNLTGFTFPVVSILFALSLLNILEFLTVGRSGAKLIIIAICYLISFCFINTIGDKYFWLPSIFVCYFILVYFKRGAYFE